MKKILFFLLTIPVFVKAQGGYPVPKLEFDTSDNKISFIRVIQAPGLDKTVLYSRLKEWVAIHYRDAQSVIQMDDPASGKLLAKGYTKINFEAVNFIGKDHFNYHTWHYISFNIKDGRFKVVISQFHFGYWMGDKEHGHDLDETAEQDYEDLKSFNSKTKKKYQIERGNLNDEFEIHLISPQRALVQKDAIFLDNITTMSLEYLDDIKKTVLSKKDDF